MQCPACELDNLPTSVRCYDCGHLFDPEKNYLNLFETSTKQEGRFQSWLRTLPLPAAIIDGDLQTVVERALMLPFIWIPGMALWAMDRYEKGLALLILTVIPLLIGFTLFNHWISNLLIPFGILVYTWSLIDGFYTWRERHYPIFPSFWARVKAMGIFVFSFMLIVIIWTPHLHFLRIPQPGFEPTLSQGDYVFLNYQPGVMRTYERGDLVAVNYSNSTTIGRIIGYPNETIYLQKGHFYNNGKQLDIDFESSQLTESNRRIDIPANSYFVLLHVSGSHLLRYSQTSIVPAHAIMGRLEIVINPAAHRKRLR